MFENEHFDRAIILGICNILSRKQNPYAYVRGGAFGIYDEQYEDRQSDILNTEWETCFARKFDSVINSVSISRLKYLFHTIITFFIAFAIPIQK